MMSINNALVYLCRTILDALFPQSRTLCAFFALHQDELHTLSQTQQEQSGYTHALFTYTHNLVRTSIRALKYKNNKRVAAMYAPCMARYAATLTPPSTCNPCLVPIPMSPRRKKLYGFNQCDTICRAMCAYAPGTFTYLPNALIRSNAQVSQTRLSRMHRFKNVAGAFIAPQSLAGLHLIIIDDVKTTGATATAATQACYDAGALSVHVLTIAHQPYKIKTEKKL